MSTASLLPGLLASDATLRQALASISPPTEITRFTSWNRDLQHALASIEEGAFSADLRYSYTEMLERAARPGFEGILLSSGPGESGSTAAIMIVYRLDPACILYLDTIAVRDPGHGVGTALLQFLIRRCTGANDNGVVSEIRLDTEGGAGSSLPAYYERFGFRILAEDSTTGNVSMSRLMD